MHSSQARRPLLRASAALTVALLLVLLVAPHLQSERVANLDLDIPGITNLYLQTDAAIPGRCYVTDRQRSTIRRSDDSAAGKPWQFISTDASSDSEDGSRWLVSSKRGGGFLLAPLFAVTDWGFPYAYAFVRDRGATDALPRVRWVQLYVNRIYRGLFLQADLPRSRAEATAEEATEEGELLLVSGARMTCAKRDLAGTCRVYPSLVAQGQFPAAASLPSSHRWLLSISPVEERLYILEPFEPFAVREVPIAISFIDHYRRIQGRDLVTSFDERFREWAPPRLPEVAAESSFSPAEFNALRGGWEGYRNLLVRAITVHCLYRNCADRVPSGIENRLNAGPVPTSLRSGGMVG